MKEYLSEIVKCVRCGRCRTVCPVQQVQGWEFAGARGRMQMAMGMASGLEPSAGMVRSILTCTTCHQCVTECPTGADPQQVTWAARRKLVGLGHVTPHQLEMQERIRNTGNSLDDKSARTAWITAHQVPGKSGYVYFAGCLASYRYQSTATATYGILEKFGVGLLEDEKCCGSPLFRMGLDASELIEHNSRQFKEAGAHTIIVGCAGCYSMLREQYQGFDVLHLSEFLAERLDELSLSQLDISVTYHDPCHLGRTYGIYDAPRQVIEKVCTLVEMKASKENASCCGGGGGVRMGYPELSGLIAEELKNNIPNGVDYAVTSCPLCFRNLADTGINVLDLAELVSMAMKL
ncbi:MAG: CoB--CoM heterodisulfide reductase iron-sulfur subunit D [Candidatus Methanocomedens sp.]|nr:MAG: CoB--CoM heterodisulfide reductase iron-sulfur subunit D [ANME-2 cluster archaeon]